MKESDVSQARKLSLESNSMMEKLAIAIDEAKVKVKDEAAQIPAEAVSITRDGKEVDNNDELAAHLQDLVLVDGEWLIAFPADTDPSASPSPSATATKK